VSLNREQTHVPENSKGSITAAGYVKHHLRTVQDLAARVIIGFNATKSGRKDGSLIMSGASEESRDALIDNLFRLLRLFGHLRYNHWQQSSDENAISKDASTPGKSVQHDIVRQLASKVKQYVDANESSIDRSKKFSERRKELFINLELLQSDHALHVESPPRSSKKPRSKLSMSTPSFNAKSLLKKKSVNFVDDSPTVIKAASFVWDERQSAHSLTTTTTMATNVATTVATPTASIISTTARPSLTFSLDSVISSRPSTLEDEDLSSIAFSRQSSASTSTFFGSSSSTAISSPKPTQTVPVVSTILANDAHSSSSSSSSISSDGIRLAVPFNEFRSFSPSPLQSSSPSLPQSIAQSSTTSPPMGSNRSLSSSTDRYRPPHAKLAEALDAAKREILDAKHQTLQIVQERDNVRNELNATKRELVQTRNLLIAITSDKDQLQSRLDALLAAIEPPTATTSSPLSPSSRLSSASSPLKSQRETNQLVQSLNHELRLAELRHQSSLDKYRLLLLILLTPFLYLVLAFLYHHFVLWRTIQRFR
jgi:hypothetical protein